MTEEQVGLYVDDDKVLYGKYSPRPGAPLVVLVHGLTGHMDEALHYNAARRLEAEGFAVLRFNLYGAQLDTRRLTDCTTRKHARDLDVVIRQLSNRLPGVPVAVIGHSLGGLTALLATEPYDALVLWDASHTAALGPLRDLEYVTELGLYRWRQRIDHLLNPAMVDELRTLDSDALVAAHTTPVLVAAADEPGRPEVGRRYAELAGGPATFVLVSGADHSFAQDETASVLLDATVAWLRETLAGSGG